MLCLAAKHHGGSWHDGHCSALLHRKIGHGTSCVSQSPQPAYNVSTGTLCQKTCATHARSSGHRFIDVPAGFQNKYPRVSKDSCDAMPSQLQRSRVRGQVARVSDQGQLLRHTP